ncbi:hypothetical protein [Bacillus phage vB_BteM-A9Y]|nr:hypothetical protein [Bacillus phage vB_BteM-A9Y]
MVLHIMSVTHVITSHLIIGEREEIRNNLQNLSKKNLLPPFANSLIELIPHILREEAKYSKTDQ